MTAPTSKDIAIIIPARNEAERIGACLRALNGQFASRVRIILVLNNTDDETHEIALETASSLSLDVKILERVLMSEEGVGSARRIGCDYAIGHLPHLRYLLTTDADCVAAPDWVSRNIDLLQSADAVCGKIELLASEKGVLDGMNPALATNEGQYRKLVQTVYARYAPRSADIDGTHGEAAGASLAFRKTAYQSIGGFEAIKCGEDRQIIRAMRLSGRRVLHTDDAVVYASCRLTGRAVGGMSDALKARIEGTDYLVDDCLPGADWLVANARMGTLGVWPPIVPESGRVHVRDLLRHIQTLNSFVSLIQVPIAEAAVPATTEGRASSQSAALRYRRGPTCVPAGPTSQNSPISVGFNTEQPIPTHRQMPPLKGE